MEDCIVKINQILDQLAPAENRVAHYMLENSHEVIGQTIDQVATACQTSKTTVVRLCKQLGYKGYKAFCIALSTDLASGGQNRISYQDVSPTDDLHTICQHVSRHNQAAIADTMRVLKEEDLTRVVEAVHQASRVDFYGVGSSGLVALDAQQKFQRLGKETQTTLDPHVQVVTAARLSPGDVAVLFSYSGETTDIIDTLESVKRAGATAVAVTRFGGNRLSRCADISLCVASSEMLVRSAAAASRTAMLHIVDLIFFGVATMGYDTYKPYLDRTHLEGRAKRRAQKERRSR